MPLLPSSFGLPAPQVIQEVVSVWSPDTSMFMGQSMLLPMKSCFVSNVEWDEYGAFSGLTAAYAPGTDPLHVKPPVFKHYTENPLYWKETAFLKEQEFINIRQAGTYGKLAGEEKAMLLIKQQQIRLDSRIEQQVWATLMNTNIVDENGVKKTISYTLGGTPTAGVLWSTVATANPIADLQAWCELLRGKSRGGIKAYMNGITVKYLAQNQIVRDLVRQSTTVLQIGKNNVASLVAQLVGNLSDIVVYDEGYQTAGGTYVPFIPDGKVLLVGGTPDGSPIGYFQTTPTVHNGGMNPKPGRFALVHDNLNEANPCWGVTTGIYGIPTLNYPQCLILATVA